jgi:hypothetical protein
MTQASDSAYRLNLGMLTIRHFLLTAIVALVASGPPSASAAVAPEVHIAGNHFVDGAGHVVRLIGTTAGVGAGGACVEPTYHEPARIASHNTFYTPVDDQQLALMRSWHMNTVRVTLNEGCWLGLAPVRYRDDRIVVVGGAAGSRVAKARMRSYRRIIVDLVNRAHAMGFMTIVDLHYNAPGRSLAFGQWPMPDRDHSPKFWRSVVKTFKNDRSMVFEVFNEPFDKAGKLTWACLRNGCRLANGCADCDSPVAGCSITRCPTSTHPRGTYRTAGMQELVNVIRAAGAKQPLVVPGRQYAGDLSQWLQYMPQDPLKQLGATFHMYGDHRYDNGCDDVVCWNGEVGPVAARVPVTTTELGQFDCEHAISDAFMDWADGHGVSYQQWGWYRADFPPCGNSADDPLGAPTMLLDYAGNPSPEGVGFKTHLAALHVAGELP